MDSCSNTTNIDADLAKEMGLLVEESGIEREINFLERKVTVTSDIVSFMLSPLDGHTSYKLKAYTIKDLVSGTPVVDWLQVSNDFPHLKSAEIPKVQRDDKVQILLGTDYSHLNGVMHGLIGRDFEPIAESTKLGWAFSGRVKNSQILASSVSNFGNAIRKSFGFCTFLNLDSRQSAERFPTKSESVQTGIQTPSPIIIPENQPEKKKSPIFLLLTKSLF